MKRLISAVKWLVIYLLLSVLWTVVLFLTTAYVIQGSNESELGRAATGLFTGYLSYLVSFFCISPLIIYAYALNRRRLTTKVAGERNVR